VPATPRRAIIGAMKPREVLDRTTTPDGRRLELAREGVHYVIRVDGVALMSSAAHGSEEAMARVAAEALGARPGARVLVGGLGLGFTLRAALDAFPDATVTVAELLPPLVGYNRGALADLARRPLDDPRVRLFEGDVRVPLGAGGWDAVLLDVDNGPEAFTTSANASLYDDAGAALLARALAPGGVLVVWSAGPSPAFERRLRRAGLACDTRRARARDRKGATHTLFVARAPR
jgi:spermidine synthase